MEITRQDSPATTEYVYTRSSSGGGQKTPETGGDGQGRPNTAVASADTAVDLHVVYMTHAKNTTLSKWRERAGGKRALTDATDTPEC